MKNDITISIGKKKEGRKAALLRAAHEGGAYGRNGVPSISELLCIIADYADMSPERMFEVAETISNWKHARDEADVAKK